jgi:hypothetical protein
VSDHTDDEYYELHESFVKIHKKYRHAVESIKELRAIITQLKWEALKQQQNNRPAQHSHE